MRTTLNLDDDIVFAARSLADESGRSLGTMISELARKGLEPRPSEASVASGFPVFEIEEGAPPITAETVRRALDDE